MKKKYTATVIDSYSYDDETFYLGVTIPEVSNLLEQRGFQGEGRAFRIVVENGKIRMAGIFLSDFILHSMLDFEPDAVHLDYSKLGTTHGPPVIDQCGAVPGALTKKEIKRKKYMEKQKQEVEEKPAQINTPEKPAQSPLEGVSGIPCKGGQLCPGWTPSARRKVETEV